MKKTRYSPEQAIRLLREQETSGKTIVEFCREKGFTEQTFHRWKKQFAGLSEADAKRLKALEKENAKLKRLLAEQLLVTEALREVAGIKKSERLPKSGRRS